MMKMRKLYLFWGFFDMCLLAAGVVSIVASIEFMAPKHLIMNLVFTDTNFKMGITMGALYILGCMLSIPAILAPKDRPVLLKALNLWVLAAAIFTLVLGTIIWIFSLCQRENFSEIWAKQSATSQASIQDTFSCCGYWNGTAAGQLTTTTGFCADSVFAANQTGCVTPITSAKSPGTDFTLETMFSSIYGFIAVLGCFFLATVCVIKEREVEVRFAKIDEKRGGGGFV